MTPERHVIPMDAIYPRDEQHRYRLYGRIGDDLTVIGCASTPGGLGTAIVTIHEDGKDSDPPVRLADYGQLGVLDVLGGRDGKGDWVVLPFNRGRS